MTIIAGDLKKIDVDLTKDVNLAFSKEVPIGDGSGNPPKAMNFATILRNKVAATVIKTGGGAQTIDFTNNNYIKASIDNGTVITLTGLEDREKVYLKLTKATTDTFTFASFTGLTEIKGQQLDKNVVLFEITTYIDSGGSNYTIVEQVNSQETDSLTITDFSVYFATIISFDYFVSDINNNFCTYNGKFTIQAGSDISSLDITISNWNINTAQNYNVAKVYASSADVAGLAASQGLLTSNTTLTMRLTDTLTSGDTATVYFSDTLKIT